jgi:hypothetical protein
MNQLPGAGFSGLTNEIPNHVFPGERYICVLRPSPGFIIEIPNATGFPPYICHEQSTWQRARLQCHEAQSGVWNQTDFQSELMLIAADYLSYSAMIGQHLG